MKFRPLVVTMTAAIALGLSGCAGSEPLPSASTGATASKPAPTPSTVVIRPAVTVSKSWKGYALGSHFFVSLPDSFQALEFDPPQGDQGDLDGSFADVTSGDGASIYVHVSDRVGSLKNFAKKRSAADGQGTGSVLVDGGFIDWPGAHGAWFMHRTGGGKTLTDGKVEGDHLFTTFVVDTATQRLDINVQHGPYRQGEEPLPIDEIMSTVKVTK